MTKLTLIHERNALRTLIRARLIDFISAPTDEEAGEALEALINIDDLLGHHDTMHLADEKES